MGCVFEFFFELLFESAVHTYMYLMLLVVPKKMQNKKAEKAVRTFASVFSIILLVCMLVGIVFILESHSTLNPLGRILTFVPLTIIVLQIIIGVIIRFSHKDQ